MTRDLAQKLKYQKTASIYSKFFPSILGMKAKMSASVAVSTIFLTDSSNVIKKKVNKFAKSGGGQSIEEHRTNGANLDVDIPYQWLKFFLEDDDKLVEIEKEYGAGRMLTGEVKNVLIETLQKFIGDFQEKRKKVTDADVDHFMSIRKIEAMPAKFLA